MSSTNFVDFSPATPIVAAWLNDINNFAYGQIGTVAQVRLLAKTGYSKVNTLGYLAVGDGGAATYALNSLDTTSSDNGYSVIVAADGGRWYLVGEYFVSPKAFGCLMNGTTDDTTAFQACVAYCIANTRGIRAPGGVMILSQQITGTGAVSIQGEGIGNTVFQWNAGVTDAHAGFNFTIGTQPNGFATTQTYRDFSMRIGTVAIGSTALSVTCPTSLSGDRVTPRVIITNCQFRGIVNPLNDGWNTCINTTACEQAQIVGCSFWGNQLTQTSLTSAFAVNMNNSNGSSPHPTEYLVADCFISGFQTAILMNDFEGGIIRGNQIFTTNSGVVIGAPSLNYPHILITGNYINSITVAISIAWMFEAIITDNLIYAQLLEGTVMTGINLNNGASYFNISNNTFENFKTSTAMNAITCSSSSINGVINGNVFRRCDSIDTTAHGTGIWLTTGTGQIKVGRTNSFTLTTTPILNQGAFNGVANSVLNTIGTASWTEDEDGNLEQWGSTVVTLSSGGVGTITFPKTSSIFPTAIGTTVGDSGFVPGGIISIGTRSTTGFNFQVTPNPGAVTFRLDWIAKCQST